MGGLRRPFTTDVVSGIEGDKFSRLRRFCIHRESAGNVEAGVKMHECWQRRPLFPSRYVAHGTYTVAEQTKTLSVKSHLSGTKTRCLV